MKKFERWERKEIKERQEREYFISPEGRVVKWWGTLEKLDDWSSTHALIAQSLLKNKISSDVSACDVLNKLGWIAMGSACYGNKIKGEPTQAQINSLSELGFNRIVDDTGVEWKW